MFHFPPFTSRKGDKIRARKNLPFKKAWIAFLRSPRLGDGRVWVFLNFLSILRPTHRCIFFPFFRKSIRETGERSNLLPTISSHVHVGSKEKNRKINTMHRFPPIFSRVGVSHDLCRLFDLGFSMSVYSGNRLSDSVFFREKSCRQIDDDFFPVAWTPRDKTGNMPIFHAYTTLLEFQQQKRENFVKEKFTFLCQIASCYF